MLPKVSIIIPFYNCAYVDQAVVSALSQSHPKIEIIVVDDGSTQFKEKLDPFLTRIHYIGKANGGTASALNYGIGLATGEYVTWLSSDDLFYPHKVERQLQFMQEIGAMISFTAFDQIDGYNKVTARSLGPKFGSQQELCGIMREYNPINGCTVMMRKDFFASVYMFNESFRYTHDYELWVRVLLQRIPIPYLNEALIMYRWHGQMGTVKQRPVIDRELKSMYREALLQTSGLL